MWGMALAAAGSPAARAPPPCSQRTTLDIHTGEEITNAANQWEADGCPHPAMLHMGESGKIAEITIQNKKLRGAIKALEFGFNEEKKKLENQMKNTTGKDQ